MKKKFLISGLALFVGALALTFNSNISKEDTAGLFVASDNIALAGECGMCSPNGGCITAASTCFPGDGNGYEDRTWTSH
jgi:hypothetical protein